MEMSVDDMDRRIIDYLRRDAWLSYAALARLVHLSPSAVQRRVENLIAKKVIEGATVVVGAVGDSQKGLQVTLLVELADDRAGTIQKFKKAIGAEPEIREAAYTTGEFDVVLRIAVEGIGDYDKLLDRLCNRSAIVRRFKTLTTLRQLK